MGWEPTTSYVYDEAGRLISSRPEPEFDELEREWMNALKEYRASLLCPLCGMPKSVCRSPEMEGRLKAESERCHVTLTLAQRKKADAEAEFQYPESLAYTVQPVGAEASD